MMKLLLILLSFFPLTALAHAVPLSYTPERGAVLSRSPTEAMVVFTDRVSPENSWLMLYSGTSTRSLLLAEVVEGNPRALRAALPLLENGATLVWGATSLDDGHFTRGAFNFAVVDDTDPRPSTLFARTQSGPRTALALLLVAVFLLTLRAASFFVFERVPRCKHCVGAYMLLEILLGVLGLSLSALLLFAPSPLWKNMSGAEDVALALSTTRDEGAMTLVVESQSELHEPLVEVGNREASIDPMPVTLTPLLKDKTVTAYTFPKSVFVPHGAWHITTTFVRGDRYDAHSALTFHYPDDILLAKRKFMPESPLGITALACFLFTFLLLLVRIIFVLRNRHSITPNTAQTSSLFAYGVALVGFMLLCGSIALILLIN